MQQQALAVRSGQQADAPLDEVVGPQFQAPAAEVEGALQVAEGALQHPFVPPDRVRVERVEHLADPGAGGGAGPGGDVGLQGAADVRPVRGETGPEQCPGTVADLAQAPAAVLAQPGQGGRDVRAAAEPRDTLLHGLLRDGEERVEFVGQLPTDGVEVRHHEVGDADRARVDHLEETHGPVRHMAADVPPPALAARPAALVHAQPGRAGHQMVERGYDEPGPREVRNPEFQCDHEPSSAPCGSPDLPRC